MIAALGRDSKILTTFAELFKWIGIALGSELVLLLCLVITVLMGKVAEIALGLMLSNFGLITLVAILSGVTIWLYIVKSTTLVKDLNVLTSLGEVLEWIGMTGGVEFSFFPCLGVLLLMGEIAEPILGLLLNNLTLITILTILIGFTIWVFQDLGNTDEAKKLPSSPEE